jgi:hypothetical protein
MHSGRSNFDEAVLVFIGRGRSKELAGIFIAVLMNFTGQVSG